MEIKTTTFESKVKNYQIETIKKDLDTMLNEAKYLYSVITEDAPEKEELYVLSIKYTGLINEILKTQKLLEEKNNNASEHNEKQG